MLVSDRDEAKHRVSLCLIGRRRQARAADFGLTQSLLPRSPALLCVESLVVRLGPGHSFSLRFTAVC